MFEQIKATGAFAAMDMRLVIAIQERGHLRSTFHNVFFLPVIVASFNNRSLSNVLHFDTDM